MDHAALQSPFFMSFAFPFLKTPRTVQSIILSLCKPCEVIFISLCSKKAFQHVNRSHRYTRKKWKLYVAGLMVYMKFRRDSPMPSWYRIFDVYDTSRLPAEHVIVQFNGLTVPVTYDRLGHLNVYWTDPEFGMKIVIDYACCLFNMEIHGIIVQRYCLWIIDWINYYQEEYEDAQIEQGSHFTPIDYKYALENCKPKNHLRFCAMYLEKFEYTETFSRNNTLTIDSGGWVTLDNLKAMESINISLRDTELTSSDMNLFLKHWIGGGSDRLGFMRVGMKSVNIIELFEDLTKISVPDSREFKFFDGKTHNFDNTYDVQSEDAVKASILFEGERNQIVCIFVWTAT